MVSLRFAVLAIGVAIWSMGGSALATTFVTTSSNSWSPYTPGYNISTSDEFIVKHNVSLYGINLLSGGSITIENGGHLSLFWSATFNSGSTVKVESGGTLKVSQLTCINYSSDVDIYGEIITKNGTLVNYASGAITYHPGAEWTMNQYTFSNFGTLVLNEDADWKNGTVSLIQGQTTINGALSIKNLTLSNNAAIVGIGQIEVTGGQGTFSSTGTINGCQGNACIPPSTINQITYLSAGFVDDGSIPQQYDGGALPIGGCSKSLQVNDDVVVSADYQLGELIVSPGVTVTVEENVSLTICNDIVNEGVVVLENAGSIVQTKTINENEGSGKYIIYRNATTNPYEYHSISSPINSAYIPEVFMDENPCDLFCFDGATQSWLYDYADGYSTNCAGNPVTFTGSYLIPNANGIMDIGMGYFITGDADGTKVFEGNLNNGSFTVDVHSTNLGHQPLWNDDDWNLLGNPYPSAIDLEALYYNNSSVLTGNFYFWVDDNSNGITYDQSNDYAVYNNFSSIAANGSLVPNQYLGSCQGFWAVAQTNGQVTFDNSIRVSGNNTQFYKTSQDSNVVVWLDLTNQNNNFNQTAVGYSTTSTDSIDMAQDAPKGDAGTAVVLGSRIGGLNYAIQAIEAPDDYETKWVDLYVSTSTAGVHSFKSNKNQNIPSNINVWLLDTLTQHRVNILSDSFTLFLDSNEYLNRFKIGFEQTGPISPTNVEEKIVNEIVNVFTSAEGLIISHLEGKNIGTVKVFNTTGQIITSELVTNSEVIISMQNEASGVYLIQVESLEGQLLQKKIVWTK